ncbi:hypothetical protein D3C80_1248040 [compost metagenome]
MIRVSDLRIEFRFQRNGVSVKNKVHGIGPGSIIDVILGIDILIDRIDLDRNTCSGNLSDIHRNSAIFGHQKQKAIVVSCVRIFRIFFRSKNVIETDCIGNNRSEIKMNCNRIKAVSPLPRQITILNDIVISRHIHIHT